MLPSWREGKLVCVCVVRPIDKNVVCVLACMCRVCVCVHACMRVSVCYALGLTTPALTEYFPKGSGGILGAHTIS